MAIKPGPRLTYCLALALGGVLAAPPAAAANYTLDLNTCQTVLGGTWTFAGSICTVQNFSLAAADTLNVPSLRRLSLGGSCVNRGDIEIETGASLYLGAADSLENRGSVVVEGDFDNYGEVENLAGGGVSVNDGSILNEGEIINSDPGTYLTNFRGLINNYGTISNLDDDAFISNSTLSYLKNRGGLIEILAGELNNTDQGTVTNVNHGLLLISDNAFFNNLGPSSLLLNRALGEVVNGGTFTNFNFAIIENHGTFENQSRLDNSAFSLVSNEDGGTFINDGRFDNVGDGQIENIGLFQTPGDLHNACDGWLTNFGLGELYGAFDNWGGTADNLGFWDPGPILHACDYTPP